MTKKQRHSRQYYLEHRKALNKKSREYRAAHRIEIAESFKEYYLTHRKEIAKRKAEYNATHRIELSKSRAEYNATHRIEIAKQSAKHYSLHRAEYIWSAMHQRAENKNGKAPTYANVHVCKRWSGPKGQANFVSDMGQPPKGTSISRFADTGDYKLSNCAWHTRAQQRAEARKKRNGSTI